MATGGYVYRVLSDNEDPSKGLKARKPEATYAKVSSHVNGLIASPYISTTASTKAVRAFYLLALKRYNKKQEKKKSTENQKAGVPVWGFYLAHDTGVKVKVEKKFTVVSIDMEKLLTEEKIHVFNLSTKEGRDKYLSGNQKLKNYAKKYDEVLIQGFIPAKCIEVIDIEAMSDDDFAHAGFEKSDYTKDEVEELVDKTASLNI